MHFEYQPEIVCAKRISFDLEGETVHNVSFMGGCPGNLAAISRVVEGMTVTQIEEFFRGLTCGAKPTSCTDQFAQAVRKAYAKAELVAQDEKVRV